MSDTLIQVEHVSKRYCRSLKRSLWYGATDILRELTGQTLDQDISRLRQGEFHAVDDVSFELHRGECLGLVGSNGAGKSTLLKLLNGLIKPDAGRIRVRGRMGALIELGAGFHPILSGRENIFINGAILGMGRREILRRLDQIIDFAEIGDAIDAPVQTYSSGMRVRLGFAVAANLEPDILLIDEILAVGDAAFRAKCYRHLSALRERGTSIILVSHNQHSMLSTCSRGLLLNRGALIEEGSIGAVIVRYEGLMAEASSGPAGSEPTRRSSGASGVRIDSVQFCDESGQETTFLESATSCSIRVTVSSDRQILKANCGMIVSSAAMAGETILGFSAVHDSVEFTLEPGQTSIDLEFPILCLPQGRYTLKVGVSQLPMATLDLIEGIEFEVRSSIPKGNSLYNQPHEWRVEAVAPMETSA